MAGFIEHSIEHIYQRASGKRKVAPIFPPFISALLFSIVFLFIGLALRFDQWMEFPTFPAWPCNLAVGVPLFFAGLFFMNWSVFTFAKAKGTPVPVEPPPELVIDGPYAHTRNPMIGGFFIMLFGIGAFLGSVSVTFFITPGVILFMTFEIKLIEEPELEKRLGDPYKEYREKTPMFFPRLFGKISHL